MRIVCTYTKSGVHGMIEVVMINYHSFARNVSWILTYILTANIRFLGDTKLIRWTAGNHDTKYGSLGRKKKILFFQ